MLHTTKYKYTVAAVGFLHEGKEIIIQITIIFRV